jgi:hypothetical protein
MVKSGTVTHQEGPPVAPLSPVVENLLETPG